MGTWRQTPVATTDHSSDERLMSRCTLLLQTTVAMGYFCLSLLCYHCSDAVVMIGWLPMTTIAYGSLPWWLCVVVHDSCMACIEAVVRDDKGKVLLAAWRTLPNISSTEKGEALTCLGGLRLMLEWVRLPTSLNWLLLVGTGFEHSRGYESKVVRPYIRNQRP
jgi:hypothetical protein